MDYVKLIDAAKKRHGFTDYAVAKALKYKNISAIYRIRRGKLGMTAERYRALLVLANGNEKSGGSLYIMLSPLDRLRCANEQYYITETTRYAA